MKGGDIDNDLAPGVGIRFEGIIKSAEGKLNQTARGYLVGITRTVDCNVYIITTQSERLAAAFCLKWGVPYHRIIPAVSELEIPDICRAMELLTYYDVDQRVLTNINARGSGKIKAELWTSQED
jgi:hypothetical protein